MKRQKDAAYSINRLESKNARVVRDYSEDFSRL